MKYLLSLLLVGFVILSGCRKPESAPKLAPFLIPGNPPDIYNRVRPTLQNIISAQTEIVRIDNQAGMVLRFSTQSTIDNSVRLVEINIRKEGVEESRVSVSAEKFSFIPQKNHDSIDSSVETSIAGVFKTEANKAIDSTTMAVTSPASQESRQP